MTMKKIVTAGLAACGILVMILDGQTAVHGASIGIALCLKTVIPSLFPFLFLCSLLTASMWGVESPWLYPVARRLGIPRGAESLLVAAILGGYPAGAQAIGEAFRDRRIIQQDAEHLLTFSNNAGPAFLFGMTAIHFPDKETVWALWIIQILSALLTGIINGNQTESKVILSSKSTSIPETLAQTVKTMALICGWILLFQILSAFLNQWLLWYYPQEIQVIVKGLLELSSGCCALQDIDYLPLRFLVCSLFLSFGGLCVTLQTASVISTLSLKPYLRGKLMHASFCLALSLLYLYCGWIMLGVIVVLIFIFPCGIKKEVDFRCCSVYNTAIITGRKQHHAVSQKN